MFCSCGSFSMISEWFCTDWEKYLPSREYGVTIGRTVLGLAAMGDCGGGCHRSVGELWRCCEGDAAMERCCERIKLFCSRVSSAMRRLYLRACEKAMLSLDLSEWLESKCKSMAQSVGFLYRVVESLWSMLMWIFMSRKDLSWVKCAKVNLIVGWKLFMKSFMDWSCLVVPKKIRKISTMDLFQKRMAQIEHARISSWRPTKRLVYSGVALICMAVPTSWRKCLSMNERLLFFRMVSSSISIVMGLGAPGSRTLACNFM